MDGIDTFDLSLFLVWDDDANTSATRKVGAEEVYYMSAPGYLWYRDLKPSRAR